MRRKIVDKYKRTKMLLLPNCKINIGLNIVGKRADGYHDLETFFYPVPLRDSLEFVVRKDDDVPYTLSVGGFPVAGDAANNLIVKVYSSMRDEFGLPAIDITLRKNIPMGAGLGGGSSDAAFMMVGLNEAFELGLTTEQMERRVARLGADCAFFVRNKPAFATGIGDVLTPMPLSLKGLHILLVKPDVFVSTAEAYANVTPRRPEVPLAEALQQPIEEWRHTVVNDFEASVFATHPELAAVKQTLYDMGAVYAAMSGSGSTLFGLFRRPVPEAQKVFAQHFVFFKQFAQ